jgi:hypothetical protein
MFGQVQPARHVVRWCRALDLFPSTERSLRIFKAEAKEQVAKNGLLALTGKPWENVLFGELTGYLVHRSGLFSLAHAGCLAAKHIEKLPFTAAVTKPEHVEDSR